MKGNGHLIKHKVMGYTYIRMEQCMKENGQRIYSMAGDVRGGLIVQGFKGSIEMERKMEGVAMIGSMEHFMRGIGKIMKLMGLASMNGRMVESMWVIGSQILWNILEYITGLMGGSIRAFIGTTRSMAMASIYGPTRRCTLDGGMEESSMDQVYLRLPKESKGLEFGRVDQN